MLEKRNEVKFSNCKLIFGFLICIFSINLSATDDSLKVNTKWSISLSGGYGWPANGDIIGSKLVNDTINNVNQTLIRGTFGKGLTNSVVVGYSLKNHIGFEIGAFALWGNKITTADYSVSYTSDIYDKEDIKVNSKGVLAGIYLVDTVSKFELSFHNNFLWGINNQAFEHRISNSTTGLHEQQWKYSEGMSYGWMSKISAAYCFNKKFKIGLEGFFTLHSWSPHKGEMEKYTVNGVDKLSTIPDNNKNYNYSDNLTINSVSGFMPSTAFSVNYPLHAIGISFFLKYSF